MTKPNKAKKEQQRAGRKARQKLPKKSRTLVELLLEPSLRKQLTSKIMRASALGILVAFTLALFRAPQIGLGPRDILESAAVLLIILLAIIRKKISMHSKVPFLITAFTIGSIGGITTLGMYAGTVFIFPIAVVIMAIYYPIRITACFIAGILLFYGLVAAGFCSGILKICNESLITNPRHWAVYISCVAFFFMIASITIYNYRKIVRQLIHQIGDQRDELTKSNEELTEALRQVKQLSGLLPICASCKKIRDDKGYWSQIESYIHEHADVNFSHAICPTCMKKLYPEVQFDPDELSPGSSE